jgi:hypothetical protein
MSRYESRFDCREKCVKCKDIVSMVVRRRCGCTRSSRVSAQQAICTMSRKAMQRRKEDSFAMARVGMGIVLGGLDSGMCGGRGIAVSTNLDMMCGSGLVEWVEWWYVRSRVLALCGVLAMTRCSLLKVR